MILKLVHVWKSVAGTAAASSFPTAPLENAHDDGAQPSEELAANRLAEETQATLRRDEKNRREKKTREDDEYLLLSLWLVSEEYRQACRHLLNDLSDIRNAVRLAYERAAIDEGIANGELEALRAKAIVFPDGRRVYFTRDGRALFGEDLQRITNAGAIEEAEKLRATRPDAPDYETYLDKREKASAAAERAMQLADTLHRIEELSDKVKAGGLTLEELTSAQREVQEIISALPADARENYERIRRARESGEVAYRDAGSALESAPNMEAHFSKAGCQAIASATETGAPGVNCLPAYRGPQDF